MFSLNSHLSNHSGQPDNLERLLTPSWLSGLLVVAASFALVIGSLVWLYYRGSSVHLQLQQQTMKQQATVSDEQAFDNGLTAHNLLGDLPLIILWAGVGLTAYMFVSSIWSAARSAAELHEEMDYVHASREQLMRDAVERLLFRLAALVTWVLYIRFTLHVLLPYAVAAGFAGSSQGAWYRGVPFVLAGVVILAACLHLHTILIRLITLRPRLFS